MRLSFSPDSVAEGAGERALGALKDYHVRLLLETPGQRDVEIVGTSPTYLHVRYLDEHDTASGVIVPIPFEQIAEVHIY